AAALAAAAIAAPAFAQDAGGAPPAGGAATAAPGGDSLTIGAGAAYLPDYEGSDHYKVTPVPGAVGSYKGFGFQLAGNRLSIDAIPTKPGPGWAVELGPEGVVNFNRHSSSSVNDPRVKALGGVGTAIELGGYGGIGRTGVITSPYDRLSATVSYRYDVNGVHRSGILSPSISYLTPLSRKALVGFFASGEHVERGYAQTYYSVSAAQSAVSGLPIYQARKGWKSYSLGVLAAHSVTGDLLHGFKIVGGGTYSRLLNGFSDAPITRIAGRPSQWLGTLGLAYTF
ncbi:MipA/OmpV family protein, partial [Sphingomonas bacterium]|uniref:MipA/OmpV family protein n=1 Tax=Sphingomonas bacterium TaxID=1895847 RepID=UPI0020C7209B